MANPVVSLVTAVADPDVTSVADSDVTAVANLDVTVVADPDVFAMADQDVTAMALPLYSRPVELIPFIQNFEILYLLFFFLRGPGR